jgi:hypothetical protein
MVNDLLPADAKPAEIAGSKLPGEPDQTAVAIPAKLRQH